MPNLPGVFSDGTDLFAAPLNAIRTFLQSTLAFKATRSGQIPYSTAAHGSTDNVAVISPPTSGEGILAMDAGGNPSYKEYPIGSDGLGATTIENFARPANTESVPTAKLQTVSDWAHGDNTDLIPPSKVGPRTIVGGINLIPIINEEVTVPNSGSAWIHVGGDYRVPDPVPPNTRWLVEVYAQQSGTPDRLLYYYSRFMDPGIFDSSVAVNVNNNLTSSPSGVTKAMITGNFGDVVNAGGANGAIAMAQDRRLLYLRVGPARHPAPLLISQVSVAEPPEPIPLPPEATEAEITERETALGSINSRLFSPNDIVRAIDAFQSEVDQVARDAAARAQQSADSAVGTANAANVTAAGALRAADLPGLIEDYAEVSKPAAQIPTNRLADNVVTTAKIADDAVTAAKIGDQQIGQSHLTQAVIDLIAAGGTGTGVAASWAEAGQTRPNDVYFGSANPTSALGQQSDLYIQFATNQVSLWQRGPADWAQQQSWPMGTGAADVGIAFRGEYSVNQTFSVGDIVTRSGAVYLTIVDTTDAPADTAAAFLRLNIFDTTVFKGSYNGSAQYAQGDEVLHGGAFWKRLADGSGIEPRFANANVWRKIDAEVTYRGPWSGGTTFLRGHITLSVGVLYLRTGATTSGTTAPTGLGDGWTAMAGGTGGTGGITYSTVFTATYRTSLGTRTGSFTQVVITNTEVYLIFQQLDNLDQQFVESLLPGSLLEVAGEVLTISSVDEQAGNTRLRGSYPVVPSLANAQNYTLRSTQARPGEARGLTEQQVQQLIDSSITNDIHDWARDGGPRILAGDVDDAVEHWALQNSTDVIPADKLVNAPGGGSSEADGVITGLSVSGTTLRASRSQGLSTLEVDLSGLGGGGGSNDGVVTGAALSSTYVLTLNRSVGNNVTVDLSSLVGAGGGLNSTQVLGLIRANALEPQDVQIWARDTTTQIPASKLANAPAGSGGGLNESQVDARVRVGVKDFAETGGGRIGEADLPIIAPTFEAERGTSSTIRSWTASRIATLVRSISPTAWAWARDGNPDRIPSGKLPQRRPRTITLGSAAVNLSASWQSTTRSVSGLNYDDVLLVSAVAADGLLYSASITIGALRTRTSATIGSTRTASQRWSIPDVGSIGLTSTGTLLASGGGGTVTFTFYVYRTMDDF